MGDVALFVAMAVVIVYGVNYFDFKPIGSYTAFKLDTLSQTYSAIVFLMGIHTIIVPIHGEMSDQKQFDKTLSFSLLIVVISNTAFGLVAFLLYDDQATGRFCFLSVGKILKTVLFFDCLSLKVVLEKY